MLPGFLHRLHACGEILVPHHIAGQIAHRAFAVALLLNPAVERASGRFTGCAGTPFILYGWQQDIGRILWPVADGREVTGRTLKTLYGSQGALTMWHPVWLAKMIGRPEEIALRAIVRGWVAFILIAMKITARPTRYGCRGWDRRWLVARLGELRPVPKAIRLRDLVLRLAIRPEALDRRALAKEIRGLLGKLSSPAR